MFIGYLDIMHIYAYTYMCFLLIYRSCLYILNLFFNAFIASIFSYFVACFFFSFILLMVSLMNQSS